MRKVDTTPGKGDLDAHARWARRLASRLVSDPGAAEDLSQDAVMALIERPELPRDEVRPWLGRVVRNKAISLWRSTSRRERRERKTLRRDPHRDPRALAELREFESALRDAVAALKEPYRATIRLVYFEGLSVAEVARSLDVPYETARARHRRAIEQLRDRLDRTHGGRAAWAVPFAAWAAVEDVDARSMAPPGSGGAHWTSSIPALVVSFVLGGLTVLGANTLFGSRQPLETPPPRTTEVATASSDRTPSRRRGATPSNESRAGNEADTETGVGTPTETDLAGGSTTTPDDATAAGAPRLPEPDAVPEPPPTRTITGRLFHPAGLPLENPSVELVLPLPPRDWTKQPGQVDEDGSFRFADVPADQLGSQVRIEAGADGVIRTTYLFDLTEQDLQDLEIRMAGTVTLTGRVLGPDGEPGVGLDVYGFHGVFNESTALTGADGRFALKWPTHIDHPDPRVRIPNRNVQRFVIKPRRRGVDADLGDFHLQPERRIVGQVFDPDGAPKGRVRVVAYEARVDGRKAAEALTDGEGRFELKDVAGIGHTLEVWWDVPTDDGPVRFGTRTMDVAPDGPSVALHARRAHRIRLRLLDARTEDPIDNSTMRVAIVPSAAGLDIETVPPVPGTCVGGDRIVYVTAPGAYDVRVHSFEHPPGYIRGLEVGDDDSTTVELKLSTKEVR